MEALSSAIFPGLDKTGLNIESQKAGLARVKDSRDEQEIKETAQSFEAFFLTKMMESKYEGVSTDGMFGGGHAEKVYRSLLVNEYGKAMAKNGSVGVADEVMRSILEMQEMESQGFINGQSAK